MDQIHTSCQFRPFCKARYEEPPRYGKYKCNKCQGPCYITETKEKVEGEMSKPKLAKQKLTFHKLFSGGSYEGVSDTVSYHDNRRPRPEATGGGDVEKNSRGEQSRRRRGRRSHEGQAPEPEVAVEDERPRSPVRRDASLVSAAAAAPEQLSPRLSPRGSTHVSRISAQSGRDRAPDPQPENQEPEPDRDSGLAY